MSSATYLNDFTKGELLVNIRGAVQYYSKRVFIIFIISYLKAQTPCAAHGRNH